MTFGQTFFVNTIFFFEVKCTSNEFLRLRPPLGFIAPNAVEKVRVSFHGKTIPTGLHFIAIYHMPSEETKNPREVWAAGARAEGVRRLKCNFVHADGTYYPESIAADERKIKDLKKDDKKEEKKEDKKDEEEKKEEEKKE